MLENYFNSLSLLKGKGLTKEVLSTPYVRLFQITEKGIEEVKERHS